MTKKDYTGMVLHNHHSGFLVEWTWSINERIDFINKHKPEKERPLRTELLKPLKGKLPEELVDAAQACAEALQACAKARQKTYTGAGEACNRAWRAYTEAEQAYREIYAKHLPLIEALHKAVQAIGEQQGGHAKT